MNLLIFSKYYLDYFLYYGCTQSHLLYPHRESRYVDLVPKRIEKYYISFNDIIKSPLLCVWAVALILFSILRKLFQFIYGQRFFGHRKETHISSIVFESIGLLFGTTGLWNNINNKPETVLTLFLSIFGMIASIFCTGILFDQFSADLFTLTINSIEDLGKNESIIIYFTNELRNKLNLDKM